MRIVPIFSEPRARLFECIKNSPRGFFGNPLGLGETSTEDGFPTDQEIDLWEYATSRVWEMLEKGFPKAHPCTDELLDHYYDEICFLITLLRHEIFTENDVLLMLDFLCSEVLLRREQILSLGKRGTPGTIADATHLQMILVADRLSARGSSDR
ncbi:MAG: hypothetical protein SF187_28890 [Deltaproteobacteria bacterium]|nr:hypothetical protein [Deltaproteobacteria bacterium]